MKKFAAFALIAGLAGCSSDPDPAGDDPMALIDEPGATPKKSGTPKPPPKVAKHVDADALLAEMDAAATNQEEAARRLASAREDERKRREEMARMEVELNRRRSQVEADERRRREHDAEMAKLQAENRTFEERYAAEILNVKRELQKYDR